MAYRWRTITAVIVLFVTLGVVWFPMQPSSSAHRQNKATVAEMLKFPSAAHIVSVDDDELSRAVLLHSLPVKYLAIGVMPVNPGTEPIELFLEDELLLRDGSGNTYRFNEDATAFYFTTYSWSSRPSLLPIYTREWADARLWNPGVMKIVYVVFGIPKFAKGPFTLVTRDGSIELPVVDD